MSEAARERLREWGAEIAIVLGSGLGSLVESCSAEQQISYAEFPDLPRPTVSGHEGRFVLGQLNDRRIVYAQGRVHCYEGHSAFAVTACIRSLHAAGVKHVILTNAAGTVNPDFSPGSWMMIRDHLNLTGTTPLTGGGHFPDMSEVYSHEWRTRFANAAVQAEITLHEGVYAGVAGPQYETPAEVRMLRTLGADAVGMSTVLEAIQAHALHMNVTAFSCLTNWAAGVSGQKLAHQEVLDTAQTAAVELRRLLISAL